MKLALAALALCALAACSPEAASGDPSTVDRALAWDAPAAERVDCSELFAEWSDGADGSPAACWRYTGPFGVNEQFPAQLASFTEQIDAEPVSDARCMPHASGTMFSCGSVWEADGGYLLLLSGVNIEGLREAIDNPDADDLVHELTVWVSDTDPRTDGALDYLSAPLP